MNASRCSGDSDAEESFNVILVVGNYRSVIGTYELVRKDFEAVMKGCMAAMKHCARVK